MYTPMKVEQLKEIKRHFCIVIESLCSDIRQVSESHPIILHELQKHRSEIRDEVKEIRVLMKRSFS